MKIISLREINEYFCSVDLLSLGKHDFWYSRLVKTVYTISIKIKTIPIMFKVESPAMLGEFILLVLIKIVCYTLFHKVVHIVNIS